MILESALALPSLCVVLTIIITDKFLQCFMFVAGVSLNTLMLSPVCCSISEWQEIQVLTCDESEICDAVSCINTSNSEP